MMVKAQLPQTTKTASPYLSNDNWAMQQKIDGCFFSETKINLWGGGTVKIGDLVKNKIEATVIGMDEKGNLVPSKIINWFNNGPKEFWLDVEVSVPVVDGQGNNHHANKIRVTINHQFYANGKYIAACDLKPGDKIISQVAGISESGFKLIRDSLLGDGCISWDHKKVKYRESHSEKQTEYVNYLRHILGDAAVKTSNTISGFGSKQVWVASKNFGSQLIRLRNEWYDQHGKKRIPEDLSWVDDLTIAKWYMDDGSLIHSEYQKDRACFSTDSFTKKDVEKLANLLRKKYKVDAVLQKSKVEDGWFIRVNAGKNNKINALWKAIAPHVHPSLHYKLPQEYRGCPFKGYDQAHLISLPVEGQVLSINSVDVNKKNFWSRTAIGYDIETETHNYLAKGVLVHNSRLLVVTGLSGMKTFNRKGETTFCPDNIREYFEPFTARWVFDGELLNDIYYIFDLLEIPTGDIRSWPLSRRYEMLSMLKDKFDGPAEVLPLYTENKESIMQELLQATAEGVVFKRLDAEYLGKKTNSQLKYKFIKQVDCVVLDRGIESKDNFLLGMFDGNDFVDVGKCSSLTGDGPKVDVGSVVQVDILYVTKGNRLYQPVKPKLRFDKDPTECLIDQLDEYRTTKEVLV